MHSNQLINETSPYLLQHAHNPVDWRPWSQAALERAQQENKPVLLSIGYSACHWCHVMEHESFEDPETARYMNEHFVCIKVDREERPDIDKIYQTAHQMLNQRPGGWPLTVFMTPQDQAPFFIGTYFPDQPRHGMPAFGEILQRVQEYFARNRNALSEHAAALGDAFERMQEEARGAGKLSEAELDKAMRELTRQYDRVNGGFGKAPKFPHPSNLEFCLRYWARSRNAGNTNPRTLHIASHSLEAMAAGGVYDQLGGGFCRYSVDESWQIPHFEKMLYDNAQLLPLYADAWIATGETALRVIAEQTADWVIRDMQADGGGYYSSLDADSEGEEGKFYVWTREEIATVLDEDELAAVEQRFGVNAAANFEDRWHLAVKNTLDAVAATLGVDPEQARETLDRARHKLLVQREQRIHPGRDEKILTAWNGLMIKGMARAGRLLQRADLVASSEQALSFIKQQLWRDGRLLATTRDGKSHLNAYLDDHVFLIDGVLELLQCRWRTADLDFGLALAELVLDHFEDPDGGGMYFTSDDHEHLLYRDKPTHDDAIPSGNGIAAQVLQRLGHLVGEHRYLTAAERALGALQPAIARYPSGHASLLAAVDEYLDPPQIIILRGAAQQTSPWQHACLGSYAPRRLVFSIPDDVAELPGILSQRTNRTAVTAYVCEGVSCRQPITDLAQFQQQI